MPRKYLAAVSITPFMSAGFNEAGADAPEIPSQPFSLARMYPVLQ